MLQYLPLNGFADDYLLYLHNLLNNVSTRTESKHDVEVAELSYQIFFIKIIVHFLS